MVSLCLMRRKNDDWTNMFSVSSSYSSSVSLSREQEREMWHKIEILYTYSFEYQPANCRTTTCCLLALDS